jgi:hypothetical protein
MIVCEKKPGCNIKMLLANLGGTAEDSFLSLSFLRDGRLLYLLRRWWIWKMAGGGILKVIII